MNITFDRRWMAGLAILAAVLVALATPRAAPAATLSVMDYNVEGLPWPVAFGRSAALDRIGARLAALRTTGRQPHVVVLEEAFTADAQAIGARAGYRYVAQGPDSAMASPTAVLPQDRAFVGGASFFRGERSSKYVGSGLMILSDFPIVGTARVAFPAYACAGFDCLANKGVLMARIAVPGIGRPVTVVATHLNSKAASGVPTKRNLYAFRRQVDTLERFLQGHVAPDAPLVMAGDFNIGKSLVRSAYLKDAVTRSSGAAARTALATCLRSVCPVDSMGDFHRLMKRNKDWQFFTGGIDLRAIAVPFGLAADGTMLSDHIGYTATYRVAAQASTLRVATIDQPVGQRKRLRA